VRASLVLAPLGRHPAQVLQTPGKTVAHPLQLGQREQARSGAHLLRTVSPAGRERLYGHV
jgi:hypothetical protein